MEQKPDKSLKNSLLLVIVGVTLFVALQHLNLVAGALSMMIGLVMQLIAADILRGRSGTGEERVLDLTEDSVRLLVLLDRAGAFGS